MIDRLPGIRPRPSLWRGLDAMARTGFPIISTCVLLLLLNTPLGISAQAELQSSLGLVAVFFWSFHRPASTPAWAVMLTGLLLDLLGLEPFGVATTMLLLVHGAAIRFRHALAMHGLIIIWLAFLPVAAGATAVEWGLICLLRWQFLPMTPALLQFGLSVGLYPVMATIFSFANREIAAPERA